LHWVLLPTKKNAQQNAASSVIHASCLVAIWLLKPVSEHVHAGVIPRLSQSWSVLLPSDTHRKLITSITAVLLPSVISLLILPRSLYAVHISAIEAVN
jgi:hypothetical protein